MLRTEVRGKYVIFILCKKLPDHVTFETRLPLISSVVSCNVFLHAYLLCTVFQRTDQVLHLKRVYRVGQAHFAYTLFQSRERRLQKK